MKKKLLLLVTLLFAAQISWAITKTSTGNGSWNNAATWSPSGVPVAGDDVVIQAGHTVTLVSNTTIGTGSLTVNGTLDRGVRSFTAGSLSGASTGIITATSNILTVGNNASTTYAGKLSGTMSTGNALKKTGSGTLTLTGQSDFVSTNGGAVTVSEGTLKLGVANALPVASFITVGSGATFDLNGYNQTLAAALSSGPGSPAVLTNSSGTPVTLTIDMPLGYSGYTWDATMTGKIDLVVNGTDVNDWYWLGGPGIAYTGNTSVTGAATLALGAALSGNLDVAVGSMVALYANSSCNQLTLGGVLQVAGTHGNTSSSATHKNNTYFYFDNLDPSFNNVLNVATGPNQCYQPTTDPWPGSVVYGRARWGGTGWEGNLKTPMHAAGVLIMNPASTPSPIWNTSLYYDVRFTYTAATGKATWEIDFNRDGDFLDASELVTSTSPSLAGNYMQYVNMNYKSSGAAYGYMNVNNFTLNGYNFGNFSTNSGDQNRYYKYNSCTLDITATASINFAAGTSFCDECLVFNIRLSGTLPVPVELTSFTASTKYNQVILNWQTSTETDNYGFDVERRTLNKDWEKIGFVNGSGNSNSPKDYTFTDKTATAGKYTYRLKQIDANGSYQYSSEVEVDMGIPTDFALEQNYPNPFNPSTMISYQVPVAAMVQISVFNSIGEKVGTLVNEVKEPGYYEVTWNAETMPSGVYFFRINAGEFSSVKKMMLMK